jgi:hypothetical protein
MDEQDIILFLMAASAATLMLFSADIWLMLMIMSIPLCFVTKKDHDCNQPQN